MNKKFYICLFLMGLMIVAACAAPAASPVSVATPTAMSETANATPSLAGEEIKVGLLLPFSGQYGWVGSNVMPVVQMVAEEVNQSGGLNGGQIRLIQGDTEGTIDAGTTAVQKLVNVDQVTALVGPTSLSFGGVKTTITDNGVPMISPTAGTIELDQAGTDYFYRTVPSDSLGGRAIARTVTAAGEYLDREPFTTVVLMVGQSPALISFKRPIEQAMREFGRELAASLEYRPEKQSYRTEAQEALAAEPEVIILIGSPEDSVRIIQAAFEAGYTGTWFVTQDQTNAEFIELATPQLVEGIYGLEETPPIEAKERSQTFAEYYKAYSGQEVKIFGPNAYDAANVLFLAMLRAGLREGEISRETVVRNIPLVANDGPDKIKVSTYTEGKQTLEAGQEINYEGLVGPIDFDEYGNITAPFAIRQAQQGAWQTIAIIKATDLQ